MYAGVRSRERVSLLYGSQDQTTWYEHLFTTVAHIHIGFLADPADLGTITRLRVNSEPYVGTICMNTC